jgi:hypothetical protein
LLHRRRSWRAGKDVDLRQLIQDINRPPIAKVGAVDLESFYPAKDRTKLAMSLNNLLASPSFASWLEGEPLDIARILYTPEKKPRLAIFSIAHLDEAQRMFFVTILLNEILAWIRTQPGTSSLRALLYMDEVFGYFPPFGNPPAKRPMLTLLKQARAYGLGCVLATQNPVDLDYKGLSNAGTWFLGRLQTERDKGRVMEGLEGASAQAGASFNRQEMEAALAALVKRVFLMNNVHDNKPGIFQSRWAMSYLCGPLTKNQIKTLMDPVRSKYAGARAAADGNSGPAADGAGAASASTGQGGAAGGHRPVVPAGIREKFLTISERVPDGYRLEYRPGLAGKGKMHFVRKADGIDVWRRCFLLQPTNETPPDDIWQGASVAQQAAATEDHPDERAQFADLPAELSRDKSYTIFTRQLKEHLYREGALQLWRSEALEETSNPDENETDFRTRLTPMLAEKLAIRKDELEKSYANKLRDAKDRVAKAQARVSARRWQFFARIGGMLWVVFDTVMSAFGKNLPGRRRSLDPAIRSVATETGYSSSAKVDLERETQKQKQLQQQHDDELKQLEASFSVTGLALDSFELKPQKGDIEVDEVSLVWLPFRIGPAGVAEPVYQISTDVQ